MGSRGDYKRSRRKKDRSPPADNDHAWTPIRGPWQAQLFQGTCEEVLAVRNGRTGKLFSTLRVPRGTFQETEPHDLTRCIMGLVKRAAAAMSGSAITVRKPASFTRDCPTLADYLFDDAYEDGEKRKPSTMTLMRGDVAGFKVVLNDRDMGQSLWASGETVEECLLTLECLLTTPDAPWKRDNVDWKKKKPQ